MLGFELPTPRVRGEARRASRCKAMSQMSYAHLTDSRGRGTWPSPLWQPHFLFGSRERRVIYLEPLNNVNGMNKRVIVQAEGVSGVVEFDGRYITLRRKGLLARATVGKGEKRIPLKSVAAIQWKPAGTWMNGYMEFSLPGAVESRSRFGNATVDAAKNENAVVFTVHQMDKFEELRDAIEEAMIS